MNPVFKHAAQHSASHIAGKHGVSPRRGFELFKDKGVPVSKKLVAGFLGALGAALLIGLEIPLEGILATLVPLLGLGFDVAFDGLEVLILPILLSTVFLCLLHRDAA